MYAPFSRNTFHTDRKQQADGLNTLT